MRCVSHWNISISFSRGTTTTATKRTKGLLRNGTAPGKSSTARSVTNGHLFWCTDDGKVVERSDALGRSSLPVTIYLPIRHLPLSCILLFFFLARVFDTWVRDDKAFRPAFCGIMTLDVERNVINAIVFRNKGQLLGNRAIRCGDGETRAITQNNGSTGVSIEKLLSEPVTCTNLVTCGKKIKRRSRWNHG